MKLYYPYKSDKKDKKYYIITMTGDRVYFGDSGYEDYTIHKDIKRRESYKRRHEKNEDWTTSGINTPGFWAWHYLWSQPNKKKHMKILKKYIYKLIYF